MRARSLRRTVGPGLTIGRGRSIGRRLGVGRRLTVWCGLVGLVGLALAASGCTTEPSEPPTSKPTGPAPAVEFTASVEPKATAIDIRYRLVNRDDKVLYALNRVFSAGSADSFKSTPNDVYVTVRRGGGVEIAKRAFDLPPGMMADAPAMLSGTPLAPGESVEESFSVSRPLERRHPYGNRPEDGPTALPDPIRYVVFCLGVVDVAPLDIPAAPGKLIFDHDAWVTQAQHVFCSDRVPLT
mgnify:FL=1